MKRVEYDQWDFGWSLTVVNDHRIDSHAFAIPITPCFRKWKTVLFERFSNNQDQLITFPKPLKQFSRAIACIFPKKFFILVLELKLP